MTLTVYTDGGAKPNPGPGGWGAVLVAGDGAGRTVRELSGGERRTTNNRMELTAAAAALEAVAAEAPGGIRPAVAVVTDSQYLRRGITEWLRGWIARGWIKADGLPVENVDLWQRVAAAAERCHVQWRWVKGHAGHKWNERADRLATAARERVAGGGGKQSWVGGERQGGGAEGAREGRSGSTAGGSRPEGQRWPAVARPEAPPAEPRDSAGPFRLEPGVPARASRPSSAQGHPQQAVEAPYGTGPSQAPALVPTQPSSSTSVRVQLRVSGRAGGSWAALLRPPDGEERLLRGSSPKASANLLDLLAATAALEALPEGAEAEILTGSEYLRLGATVWLHDWRRRGWRTASGKAVANEVEWRRLADLLAKRRVGWPEPDEAARAEIERLGEALNIPPE